MVIFLKERSYNRGFYKACLGGKKTQGFLEKGKQNEINCYTLQKNIYLCVHI